MLKERRRGRPPRPPTAASSLATTRVRRLVEDVHGGNLLAASAHAGVPYAALREVHAGRRREPGRAMLERLARAYQLPDDWFTRADARDDGTIPLAGWVGFLPADPESSEPGEFGRAVTIPFAAWPLVRVLGQLEARLGSIPPSPMRPILGAATDPRECRRRLTEFILQPLTAASGAGVGPDPRGPTPDGRTHHEWIAMLRALGRFWERALGGMM